MKGYNPKSTISKTDTNTQFASENEQKLNKSGAYNIYYRSYVMNSSQQEQEWIDDNNNQWDITNSEYKNIINLEEKTDSNYTESTLKQTPISSEWTTEFTEEKEEIFKLLPVG